MVAENPSAEQLVPGQLPPLLVSKSKKGYYFVMTYTNKWDPVNKRSMRVDSRVAGEIEGGEKDGRVRFRPEFVSRYPLLEKYDILHQGKKWYRRLRPEVPETADEVLETLSAGGTKLSELEDSKLLAILRKLKGEPLAAGATRALGKIAEDSGIASALKEVFPRNGDYLKLLSLAEFLVIERNNALSNYPEFAENTLLPYPKSMDSSVISRLLQRITVRQTEDFLSIMCEEWMKRYHKDDEPVFLALDSTSISTCSVHQNLAGFGKNRDGDDELQQINIVLMVDHRTGLPVWYRVYNGAVPDVSTVSGVIRASVELGLKYRVILVSDKGYVPAGNITEAIISDIGFIFNCKVNSGGSWVQDEIIKAADRLKSPDSYDDTIMQHAVTVKVNWKYEPFPVNGRRKSFSGSKELFLHLYFDEGIYLRRRQVLLRDLSSLKKGLNGGELREEELSASQRDFRDTFLVRDGITGEWAVNGSAVDNALRFRGIRALVSDSVGSALEAHREYAARNCVESAFRTLKDHLDCDRFLTSDDDATWGKCFLQFTATVLTLMVRFRLAAYDDRVRSGQLKGKPIHLSDHRVIRSLHGIKATKYPKGFVYDEIVGKKLAMMTALNVKPPSKERFTHDYSDGVDDESEVDPVSSEQAS